MYFILSIGFIVIGRLLIKFFKKQFKPLETTLYSTGIALIIIYITGLILGYTEAGFKSGFILILYCLPGILPIGLLLYYMELKNTGYKNDDINIR